MFFALRTSRHTTSFFAEIPRVKNGREVAPHRFLFRRKSASRHLSCWGRATHLPFSLKIRESAPFCSEVAPHDSLFRSPPAWLGDSGIPSKGIPCAFSLQNASTTRETCEHKREQNASTPGPRRHSSGTTLPFPSVIELCTRTTKFLSIFLVSKNQYLSYI